MYLARNEKIENGKIRHPISKKYTKIRKSENPGSLEGHLSLRYGSVNTSTSPGFILSQQRTTDNGTGTGATQFASIYCNSNRKTSTTRVRKTKGGWGDGFEQ